ncbi:MAG TPA: hypothetical protein VNL94_04900 [Candidatus Binatia bacterium]|nr:hypothetical protein [Candidatus Binatia bacterium]
MSRPVRAVAALAACLALAGCSALQGRAPTPSPESFAGVLGKLAQLGIHATTWTSGDAGCDDATLHPTAIRFEVQGLDQPTPVLLRIYTFRNRETWERRVPDVESCLANWATDPETFEVLEVSPYVVAGQGPWPPQFEAAMREAMTAAAGNGG